MNTFDIRVVKKSIPPFLESDLQNKIFIFVSKTHITTYISYATKYENSEIIKFRGININNANNVFYWHENYSSGGKTLLDLLIKECNTIPDVNSSIYCIPIECNNGLDEFISEFNIKNTTFSDELIVYWKKIIKKQS